MKYLRAIIFILIAVLSISAFASCATDDTKTTTEAASGTATTEAPATTTEQPTVPPTTAEPTTEKPVVTTTVKELTFAENVDTFTAASQIANLRSENGVMAFETTGGDPFIKTKAGALDVNCEDIDIIRIKIKNLGAGFEAQLFYTTDTAAAESEAMSTKFMYDYSESAADSDEWTTVDIYTSELTDFTGVLKGFRLDPCSAEGEGFQIESIQLLAIQE